VNLLIDHQIHIQSELLVFLSFLTSSRWSCDRSFTEVTSMVALEVQMLSSGRRGIRCFMAGWSNKAIQYVLILHKQFLIMAH